MTPLITLSHALSDVNLLGKPFQSPSFWTWKTVAKVIDGAPARAARVGPVSGKHRPFALADIAGSPADCSCWTTRRQRSFHERGRGMACCAVRRLAQAPQCR